MSEHTFMQKYGEARVAVVGFVAYLDGMAGFLREAARRLEAADQGEAAGAWGTSLLLLGQGSVPGQPLAVAGFTLEQGTPQSNRSESVSASPIPSPSVSGIPKPADRESGHLGYIDQ